MLVSSFFLDSRTSVKLMLEEKINLAVETSIFNYDTRHLLSREQCAINKNIVL